MSKSDGKDPPKDGRFRKGQSGNPNGRPKKPRSPIADALTLKMAEQKVTVRDTDGSHELTGIEVAYKARFKSVVGGSAMAQRDYIRAFEEADAARRAKIDEEIEWAHNYIRDARPIFERAAQRGEPEPPELVHPDDVIIDPKLGVRFRGPFVGDLRAALDKVIAFRDALLLQSILDDRCALKADRADPERWPGTARLMMNIVEMLTRAVSQNREADLPKGFRVPADAQTAAGQRRPRCVESGRLTRPARRNVPTIPPRRPYD